MFHLHVNDVLIVALALFALFSLSALRRYGPVSRSYVKLNYGLAAFAILLSVLSLMAMIYDHSFEPVHASVEFLLAGLQIHIIWETRKLRVL